MRSRSGCGRKRSRTAPEALVPLVLALLVAPACAEDRARPGPSEADLAVDLEAELLAPRTADATPVVAGTMIDVLVRGGEPGGQLRGVGFVARRSSQGRPVVDSLSTFFPARTDTVIRFGFLLPGQLPDNAQIDLSGLAHGPNGVVAVSAPQSIVVVQCPAGANWC